MFSELNTEIGKGVERMGIVEAAVIFTMAALYFAVVPRCIWPYQLMPNAKIGSCFFKECNPITV